MGNHNFRRIDSERVRERRNIGAHLSRLVNQVDDAARIGPKHAALVRHLHARYALANAVHHLGRRAAPPRVASTKIANRANAVGALIERFEQLVNFFWRILQICVERDHDLAASMRKPRENGTVLSKISREQNHASFDRALGLLLRQHAC